MKPSIIDISRTQLKDLSMFKLTAVQLRIIILCISLYPSEISQTDLCNCLQIKKSNASTALRDLRSCGILQLRVHNGLNWYSYSKRWSLKNAGMRGQMDIFDFI